MADIPPEARACAPFHGIRIVVPHRWEGRPFAVASCPHGTREADGRAAVQRLSAAYAAHREVCGREDVHSLAEARADRRDRTRRSAA